METANILQNGVGTNSTAQRGDSPACSPRKVERLRKKEVLFQKKPVLSQYRHLTVAASPLPFLLLHNPVCLKHGAGDKDD